MVVVCVTPIHTEIIIRATRTRYTLGEKGRRFRELFCCQKRLGFPGSCGEHFAERVDNRASFATAKAKSLRCKLHGDIAVRRACYSVV